MDQAFGVFPRPSVLNSRCYVVSKLMYTCLSILLATFNCRARGTCGPSTLNYSINQRQMRGKWNFLHRPRLISRGEG